MQGRSHADEKQMPHPYAYAEDNTTNDTGSGVVTKPRSAIRRLLAFVAGASPKTTERFASVKRRWSFATRFMPSGPDTFYLSATPETRGNAIEQSHSLSEELPLRFGMMSMCDAAHHITGLQGSPSSEPQIAMIMHGTALPEPMPTSHPVATHQDCIQIIYPGGCSLGNHQLCPPVDFFASHNGASLDQSYHSVDLDIEMDDVENAMSVDYTPLSNDFLLPPAALPVIPNTGPPDLRFSSQLFFGVEGNYDGQIASDIGNGFDPFHSTSCQHPVTPGPGRTDAAPAETEENDNIVAPPDNVFCGPPLKAPSAIVEENEADGSCTQNANPPPAVLETCRTSLIPRQYQPEVREREPDAEADVDTKDDAELREPFERETTEPLEEGEDKPPAAFLHFDQGVSTGLLEDSFRVSSSPSRQIAWPAEHARLGLKSSFPETPFVGEGQEKLLAALNAEAERLLESLERKLRSPPRVPQQIMPSATGDNESSEPFECEGTEPLEGGEDQTPTTFLNCEQRTDTRSSQQCLSSTINDDRLEAFERETTEPLEEGEDQTPAVFLSYEQRVTPNCLGDNDVDALSPIPKSTDNENEPDRSFVRESTEPLEDEPPAVLIPPNTTLEHRVATHSTTPSTPPSQMVHFTPIQSQPEPRASYSIPHSGRRLVLNKHGRPIRPLSRAQFKRTLGGAPCDLSSLANTTPWPPSGAGAGDDVDDDGDEREDRTDPSKRARCDIYKVPTDQGGNKQVRFGGSRRAHFRNAVARFSARSQGPVTPRPSILRSTGNETQLPTSPLSNMSFITLPSGAVGIATHLRSPPPSISLSRTNSRSNKNPRKTQVTETITESDSDVEPPRKPAHLFVDELDRKRRRAPHHLPTEASGGVVRHTRRRHKEDWIHERRKRGFPTDDSTSWFLGEPRKQKGKGPLSGISVRFRLPDIQPVGA
ncbi:hypothetical protein EDD17DRAFT_1759508 [Pisolithus thermaeus]|nr:hypothetical protein EV401DRAFT_2065626 [Pisolithus croceorrhizus]KAI6161132.1 hypothetical protein EDD17DRAFT_1759508 [Pisolithus thermaeus]